MIKNMRMKTTKKIIDTFSYYMYNSFSKTECVEVFGEMMGAYLWDKFLEENRDIIRFYLGLDDATRGLLIDRALLMYDGMNKKTLRHDR